MRERVEALFAVIAAHAAAAYAAEGHMRGGKMDDRVVDAAAAEGAGVQHAALGGLIGCEQVQSQRPLALYLFTSDQAAERRVLDTCSFGGGCINDTIIHLATTHMPFGGVGSSGMGSYHGKKSFDTFTHAASSKNPPGSIFRCATTRIRRKSSG